MSRFKVAGSIAALVLLLSFSSAHAQVTGPNRGGTGTSTIPTKGQVLVGQSNGTYAPQATSTLGLGGGGGGEGSVTSVALSAPTGFSVSGSPVTSSGTLTLDFASGYSLFKTASGTDWGTFFDTPSSRITAGTGIDWSGNTLNVSLADFTTANLTENTNLYFTNARAREALSEDVLGLTFNSTTGVFGTSTGYFLPTTTRAADWDEAHSWGNHNAAGYLTGNQTITLSGDASGSGETAITVTVTNDSHDHTGATLSSLDISDDTNLSADGVEIILTGDALSLGNTLTFTTGSSSFSSTTGLTATRAYLTNATSTSLAATVFVFGGVVGSTWPDFCTAITGGAGLCDGVDATVGAGSSIGTSTSPVVGELASWTSANTLGTVSTGTLSETVLGLELSATRGLVGGSAILSVTPGYTLATTSSTTEWARAYASTSALTATSPLTYTNNTGNFSIQVATNAQNGYLSSTDHSLFDDKVSSTSIDTSAELASLLTDETGNAGSVVFSASPAFTGGVTMAGLNVTSTSTLGLASSTALTISNNAYLNTFTATAGTTTNASSTNLNASASFKLGSDLITDITGSGLSISSNALTCATGSASVFGCLPTADWTIFNNKVSSTSIDTSAELASLLTNETGNAGSLVFSDSPTFSGGSAFAGLTVSGSSTLAFASSTALSVSGRAHLTYSSSTAETISGNAWLTYASSTSFGSTGNAWLTYASSTGLTATNLTYTNATGTSASTTNLAVGSYFNMLGDVITNVATWFDSKTEALSNVVLAAASVWDFGGVESLEIPNGAGNTVNATGECAFDTSDDQLVCGDGGGTARVIGHDEFRIVSLTIASTSVRFASGKTLAILGHKDGIEITQFRCYVDGGTSKIVNLTDGTNDTETITCGTTQTSDTDVATNDTFTADEVGYIEMGATSGTVDYLHFEAYARITRE